MYRFVKTYLPERSLNEVFCALTILSIVACGFILFSERWGSVRISFESQTDSRRGFKHQPCLPSWMILSLPMCLNTTKWWFMKWLSWRWLVSLPLFLLLLQWSLLETEAAGSLMQLAFITASTKVLSNFLVFNFDLKFFSICFLWLSEVSCQPWVSKPCCTKTLLGWSICRSGLLQEDRRCQRH